MESNQEYILPASKRAGGYGRAGVTGKATIFEIRTRGERARKSRSVSEKETNLPNSEKAREARGKRDKKSTEELGSSQGTEKDQDWKPKGGESTDSFFWTPADDGIYAKQGFN